MTPAEYQSALLEIMERQKKKSSLTIFLGPKWIARMLAKRAFAASDDLSRLSPPAEVAREHEALVIGVRKAASELEAVAARADIRGFAARFEAISEVDFAIPQLRDLEAKGFRIR